jgi:RimJ/RimL family protein N-acetyltransferase
MTITATSKLAPIRHRLPRRDCHDTLAARRASRFAWPGRAPTNTRFEHGSTERRAGFVPEGIAEIRPAGPDDAGALTRFYASLDDESRYRRFLQPMPRITTAMAQHVLAPPNSVLVAVDHEAAIVAEVVFAPSRQAGSHPEIAYAVAPSHRRRGLAGVMVRQVLTDAARSGEVAVEAMIGTDNMASIGLMRSLGARTRFEDGAVIAHLALESWS